MSETVVWPQRRADFRYGRMAVSDISSHWNGEYRSFILFFNHSLSFTWLRNGFWPILIFIYFLFFWNISLSLSRLWAIVPYTELPQFEG